MYATRAMCSFLWLLKNFRGALSMLARDPQIPISTVLTKMGNDYKELRRCFTEQEVVQNVHNKNMLSTG